MKVKTHLSILEYATLIGEVFEGQPADERRLALIRLRRRCHRAGLTERAPGMRRKLRISVEKVRVLELETYERLRADARFWEDSCQHPVGRVELIAPGVKWCCGCGSVNTGSAWRLPWSQQREEL